MITISLDYVQQFHRSIEPQCGPGGMSAHGLPIMQYIKAGQHAVHVSLPDGGFNYWRDCS